MSTKLTFLGTGGGRYATIYQTRSTGGLVLETNGKRIHIDPGPGALTNMSRIGMDPALTDAIMISHCHPDHYSDAEVLIEGMCRGGVTKRGELAGSVSVMEGYEGLGPRLTGYHFNMVSRHVCMKPGDRTDMCGIPVQAMPSLHSDRTAVGFKFFTDDGIVSFVCDTDHRDRIAEECIGSRVLILPITRTTKTRVRCHLCTDDAIRFADIVKPEMILFTHMGVNVIRHGPAKEAEYVERETGIRTVAADDLMTVDISDKITIGSAVLL
jgi:phosphoribosyl 1,2-cyclic phosphodiesterase